MKKLRKRAGYSLIEMLAALLILVLMVVGMGSGISAATLAYSESIFESNSATLAGILNTALGDVLRYSEDIRLPGEEERGQMGTDATFLFTNYDYNVKDAYFSVPADNTGTGRSTVQLKNLQDPRVIQLVNTGAYPRLKITDFSVTYHAGEGYFDITYTIADTGSDTRSREVRTAVHLLNAPASE